MPNRQVLDQASFDMDSPKYRVRMQLYPAQIMPKYKPETPTSSPTIETRQLCETQTPANYIAAARQQKSTEISAMFWQNERRVLVLQDVSEGAYQKRDLARNPQYY